MSSRPAASAHPSLAEARRIVDFAVAAAAVTCSRRGADLPRRAEAAAP